MRLIIEVDPPLSKENRRALSSYVSKLKRHRPGYFIHSKVVSFVYRGSGVRITKEKP